MNISKESKLHKGRAHVTNESKTMNIWRDAKKRKTK